MIRKITVFLLVFSLMVSGVLAEAASTKVNTATEGKAGDSGKTATTPASMTLTVTQQEYDNTVAKMNLEIKALKDQTNLHDWGFFIIGLTVLVTGYIYINTHQR